MDTGEIVDRLLLLVIIASAALMLLGYLRTLRDVIANRKKDTTRWVESSPSPSASADLVYFGTSSARQYAYERAAHLCVLLVEAAGVATMLASILAAVVVIVVAIRLDWPPFTIDLVKCVLLGDLLAGWIVGATLISAFPTVWLTQPGIIISAYFIRRVMIPWAELVDVKPLLIIPGCYLVRAERITQVHQLYGWLARSRWPGFIIHQSIDNREQLLEEIRRRTRTAHYEEDGGGHA